MTEKPRIIIYAWKIFQRRALINRNPTVESADWNAFSFDGENRGTRTAKGNVLR